MSCSIDIFHCPLTKTSYSASLDVVLLNACRVFSLMQRTLALGTDDSNPERTSSG